MGQKDRDGELVRGREEVRGRRKEYSEDLLNFRDDRELKTELTKEGEYLQY